MAASLVPTVDPFVYIEEQREGYVRYRQVIDRKIVRRWEVHGTCDYRGDCLIGSVIDGVSIRDHAHLAAVAAAKAPHRVDTDFDVPVTPEFGTCCGLDLFAYVELAVDDRC
jgi:hypothetical protein